MDDGIVIRTLAMDHVTSRHTSVALVERVLAVLEKYGIEIQQVFAITTDNGSNMLKTTDLINELQPTESERRYENVLELLNESLAAVSFPDIVEDDTSDDNGARDIAKTTEENTEKLQNTVESIIASSTILNFTNAISCAAHTLQMGIRDAFGDEDFVAGMAIIKKCIKLVKALRANSVLAIIDREGNLRPIKLVQTRWNSIYKMVCTYRVFGALFNSCKMLNHYFICSWNVY